MSLIAARKYLIKAIQVRKGLFQFTVQRRELIMAVNVWQWERVMLHTVRTQKSPNTQVHFAFPFVCSLRPQNTE